MFIDKLKEFVYMCVCVSACVYVCSSKKYRNVVVSVMYTTVRTQGHRAKERVKQHKTKQKTDKQIGRKTGR